MFCKIRLLSTPALSVEFALMLQNAGCSLLAVHGRQVGSTKRRRCGAADLQVGLAL